MPLKPGNYYSIAAVIQHEIMFLKDGEENLFSRTLREAKFFYNERRAKETCQQTRRRFSRFVVKNLQVLSIDIFGEKENLLVSMR